MGERDKIKDLTEIIRLNNLIFLVENIGSDSLTEEERDFITSKGFKIEEIESHQHIKYHFHFGKLTYLIPPKKINGISYKDLQAHVLEGQTLPLSKWEKATIAHLENRMYSDITGLGNKWEEKIGKMVIEADQKRRSKYEKIIKEKLVSGVSRRANLNEIKSELGKITGDWSRDFGRIVDYNTHEAFDYGRAAGILGKQGDDALVFKDTYPGACTHCLRLYRTNGQGSKPVIFKLTDLIANGNNIGRKAKDWLPVVGATHPWCRCTLNEYREDYEWDEELQAFATPKKYVPKIKRKSKAYVTVGDKKYEI